MKQMTMLLIFVRSIFITYIRKELPVAGPVDIQKYEEKLSLAGFMYNQQLFHKPNPKCHSPGIIYSRFEVLSFVSDHWFGCIGDSSVVGKGS